MNNRGIVRNTDDLGRIVIPKEMRKAHNIKEGDPLEIFNTPEGILIKKYVPVENFDVHINSLIDSILKQPNMDTGTKSHLNFQLMGIRDMLNQAYFPDKYNQGKVEEE